MSGARRSSDGKTPHRPTTRSEASQTIARPPSLKSVGLSYSSDTESGLRRRRKGKGFHYVDAQGRRVVSEATLSRIRRLAIPPAYTDVWICKNPRGHLQATGRDARGRKQYRYHPDWRDFRDAKKFMNLVAFGRKLPKLRQCVRRDLRRVGLSRDKVLALVTSLLMETHLRIGNAEYSRENHSYGLTTLRSRHIVFLSGKVLLRFRGKGGKPLQAALDDPRLVRLVRQCHDLPGQRLFQYVDDEGGKRHALHSQDVNAYLQEIMGEAFTAKDFRTWIATFLAISLLAQLPISKNQSMRKRKTIEVAVLREIADALGNTPTVCRKSYVCPEIFAGWRDGTLQRYIEKDTLRTPARFERAVVTFLAARLH
ncbi:MAG TPA: DNA topoisomerase IB [Rhodanobacteraceae bacterium]|nr:DNA topoisomerase IB [Rhodanobacteraceae bacterium]